MDNLARTFRSFRRFRLLAIVALGILTCLPAYGDLTISPLTWNIVGLDSNSPASGPRNFPVGARVCSDVATTNVDVEYVWDSANANIALRAGSLSTITLPSISAGGCADAYFEVEVNPVPAAYDTTRGYHITAMDLSGTVSTPTPRELFVERLISQSRNAITGVAFGPDELNLQTVSPGGSMNLVVGNTYAIQLQGGTATQGYNQFEAFINFPNPVFQILSVSTTYSANDSPFVSNPSDKLYADACLWENDPNSPKYRSCVGGDFKAGGSNVVTTYTIRIIGGGGTTEKLNSLLYDFSGASYHYNADHETSAVFANVIDPTNATITKSFSPNPTNENGVSALTITLGNPNPGALSGYNFVDNLPAGMEVAATPAVTTSGCGTPTVAAVAGSGTISFSNGTIAANGSCVVKVNVTPTAIGTLTNTTGNLFIDTVDTGTFATADLTVNDEPPPGTGICGQTLAEWTFPPGFSVTSPAASTANVTASAKPGDGVTAASFTEGTNSWGSNGNITTGAAFFTESEEYFEFAIDTTGYTSISLTFDAARKNTPNSPQGLAVYHGTTSLTTDGSEGNGIEPGTAIFGPDSTALPTGTTAFTSFGAGGTIAFTPAAGTSYVRIYVFNSGNTNAGSDVYIDNVTFTGCAEPIQPTLTKAFSPDPVSVNGVSTLTFTLTNSNSVELTGAKFTDSLPSGLQVAATPAAATSCTGGSAWTPGAGSTTLELGQTTGYTIPASGSCTASVNVTATTAGPHTNISGFLSTTEGGTNTAAVATDSLTAVLPPVISKQFAPDPILQSGVSTLTFTITNPNQDDAIGGVAFTDTFPTSPANMVVAATPNASASGCGAPVFSPSAGAGSIAFSGGTIAAGATCIVEVDVTAPTIGTYVNTSGNVSFVINAQTVSGNTASGTLEVEPPSPAIELLKQVGPSATGPWSNFLPVSSGSVHYRFTIENAGDVELSDITITDDTLDVSACNA
jgi:uncharacterized repeat protein (TIGR01451 family)